MACGRLFVREERVQRQDTILETRATPAGRVLGPGGEPLAANYDVFCIVDWSPDSRYLLVAEVISPWAPTSWASSTGATTGPAVGQSAWTSAISAGRSEPTGGRRA